MEQKYIKMLTKITSRPGYYKWPLLTAYFLHLLIAFTFHNGNEVFSNMKKLILKKISLKTISPCFSETLPQNLQNAFGSSKSLVDKGYSGLELFLRNVFYKPDAKYP